VRVRVADLTVALQYPITMRTIDFNCGVHRTRSSSVLISSVAAVNQGEYDSLAVWTKEGQQLTIDLSVQFRLDRNHIVGACAFDFASLRLLSACDCLALLCSDIYRRYYNNWFTIYTQIAMRSIKAVTIQYNSTVIVHCSLVRASGSSISP
jgi:hypothetical protein